MPVAIKLTLHLVVHVLFLCFTDTAPDIYELSALLILLLTSMNTTQNYIAVSMLVTYEHDAELYHCLHASDIWCDY
jgi:ABC-type polysaccharide/polyol phosphate export permease